jgi:type IV pilus assembly protein PilM
MMIGARLQKLFEPQLPAVACEINSRSISVVRLDPKNATSIERFGVTPLPPALLTPSLTQPNIKSMPDFIAILKSGLARADVKTQRISVAIPDGSAKVSMHQLDMLGGNENEKQQLLRWRLKKTVPFNVEEANLSYLEHKDENGKHSVMTVCIHKEVLNQYEEAFIRLGMLPGFMSLSSFAAFELLARMDAESGSKSILFLRNHPSGISSLIAKQGRVLFFRQVDHDGGAESDLNGKGTDMGANLYNELHPAVMYYQDKLGGKLLDKICVACLQNVPATILSSLSEAFRSPVMNLDPSTFFRCQQPEALNSMKNALIPSLGLALGRF